MKGLETKNAVTDLLRIDLNSLIFKLYLKYVEITRIKLKNGHTIKEYKT